MSPPLAPKSASQISKPQRVLACVRCQQRKIKCDRKFPCSNCSTSGLQCVPATLTQRGPRRRRFPERELLDRLRKYEDLLRQNHIEFEPLHKDPAILKHSSIQSGDDGSRYVEPEAEGLDCPSPATTIKSERVYEAKNFWDALNSKFSDPDNDSNSSQDDLRDILVQKVWVQLFGDNDHLLFGSPNISVDLSTLHPEPLQIFRLWQIYLDNVNPLIKVTHTPTLQGRIIEAAGNVTNISPPLDALMFSIYCVAILSFDADDCYTTFGSSKKDLSTKFQFGCQQALLNCSFLRSSELECLTALYLYLLSIRPCTVPQSLSAMLGVAIRIGQRMGIHSESILVKYPPFEAELRRRLWWSLVLLDTRISEMAGHKNAILAPTWDCMVPLNVNDSDLVPEMKELPMAQCQSTDTIFAVVRSELGEFVRHTIFHLDFTNPALKPLLHTGPNDSIPTLSELAPLEKMIEDKYLRFCDQENPLHLMTILWTQIYLAKCRLLEHHSRYSSPTVRQTDAQRDAAISYALRMLECDTKLRTSPLTRRFLWLTHLHFPFPAYIQIVQDFRRRPDSKQADQAWEVMSDNFEAWFVFIVQDDESPFFKVFVKMVFQAWQAREAVLSQSHKSFTLPRIVSSIKNRVDKMAQSDQVVNAPPQPDTSMIGANGLLLPMPVGFESLYSMGSQGIYPALELGDLPMPGGIQMDSAFDELDWSAMNWN